MKIYKPDKKNTGALDITSKISIDDSPKNIKKLVGYGVNVYDSNIEYRVSDRTVQKIIDFRVGGRDMYDLIPDAGVRPPAPVAAGAAAVPVATVAPTRSGPRFGRASKSQAALKAEKAREVAIRGLPTATDAEKEAAAAAGKAAFLAALSEGQCEFKQYQIVKTLAGDKPVQIGNIEYKTVAGGAKQCDSFKQYGLSVKDKKKVAKIGDINASTDSVFISDYNNIVDIRYPGDTINNKLSIAHVNYKKRLAKAPAGSALLTSNKAITIKNTIPDKIPYIIHTCPCDDDVKFDISKPGFNPYLYATYYNYTNSIINALALASSVPEIKDIFLPFVGVKYADRYVDQDGNHGKNIATFKGLTVSGKLFGETTVKTNESYLAYILCETIKYFKPNVNVYILAKDNTHFKLLEKASEGTEIVVVNKSFNQLNPLSNICVVNDSDVNLKLGDSLYEIIATGYDYDTYKNAILKSIGKTLV